MGIYDRDYVRREPPRGGGVGGRAGISGLRAWSVNAWLIAICIAMFVIDGFLPTRLVVMQTTITQPELVEQLDDSAIVPLEQVVVVQADPRTGEPLVARRPLVWNSPQGPVQVGYRELVRMQFLQSWLHFSTARALVHLSPTYGLVGFEFWRFIGFQFLHASTMHLVFNMIALYFLGPLVEQYLGGKRYLAFYLLSGIFGALLYMALNLAGFVVTQLGGGQVAVPGLIFSDPTTPLIGASAGVFGVLMAGAYLAPNVVVLLFFFLPMRLKTLAYVLLIVALWTVISGGHNAGGEAGHIGGALAGAYFIRHPRHLHGFFDILGRVDPTSHHYRGRKGRRSQVGPGPPSRDAIDRILDKVHREGIRSLSAKEKRILEEASRTER